MWHYTITIEVLNNCDCWTWYSEKKPYGTLEKKNYDTILKTIELWFTIKKTMLLWKKKLVYYTSFFLLGQQQCIHNICYHIKYF